PRLAGVTFTELSRRQRSQGMYGAVASVVQPNSRAAAAGLVAGDLVIGVDNMRITDLRMLRELAGVRPRQLALVVADDQGTHYVLIQ
ncbi:MAG: PDZ domain-containing protein, partial [Xanthomonadaceae bacterium]|nr:PDZ domain-containing protein [Xanthomonadaceae bacterium]